MFPCECSEIFKKTYLEEHLQTAAFASQPCVAFHIETSHLYCKTKQVAGAYVK